MAKNHRGHRTIGEAAEILGVSVSTVRRMIRKGAFPPPRRVFFGTQSVPVFGDRYMQRIDAILDIERKKPRSIKQRKAAAKANRVAASGKPRS